jgi:hypothetical protein
MGQQGGHAEVRTCLKWRDPLSAAGHGGAWRHTAAGHEDRCNLCSRDRRTATGVQGGVQTQWEKLRRGVWIGLGFPAGGQEVPGTILLRDMKTEAIYALETNGVPQDGSMVSLCVDSWSGARGGGGCRGSTGVKGNEPSLCGWTWRCLGPYCCGT